MNFLQLQRLLAVPLWLLGPLLMSLNVQAQNLNFNRVDFPHHVVIGPTCYGLNVPAGYNLFVEGGILTERLRVATRNGANWADYVFAPKYRLAPLTEVRQYIIQHGHLPGIPSAQQVATEGVDVGLMQAKLLEKIEELTLHVIRQEQDIKRLRQQLNRRPRLRH